MLFLWDMNESEGAYPQGGPDSHQPGALIVLEGKDAAGKSTLAKEMVRHCDAVHLHCRYRFKRQMFWYHTAVLRKAVALSATRPVVIDRHWLSEAIYASVYRGGTLWPQEGRFMDRVIQRWGGLTVVALPNPETMDAVTHDAALKHTSDGDRAVAKAYRSFYCGNAREAASYAALVSNEVKCRRDVIAYDYTEHRSPEKLKATAINVVEHARERRRQIDRCLLNPKRYNVVGNPRAKVVVYLPASEQVANRWPHHVYEGFPLQIALGLQLVGISEQLLAWVTLQEAFEYDPVIHAYSDSKAICYDRETARILFSRGIDAYVIGSHAGEDKCQFARRVVAAIATVLSQA